MLEALPKIDGDDETGLGRVFEPLVAGLRLRTLAGMAANCPLLLLFQSVGLKKVTIKPSIEGT